MFTEFILGPEFDELFYEAALLEYLLLGYLALVAGHKIREFIKSRIYRSPRQPQVHDYELAYLARGQGGAAELAVVKLFIQGRLRFRDGSKNVETVRVRGDLPSDPIEAGVYESFKPASDTDFRNLDGAHFSQLVSSRPCKIQFQPSAD